MATQVFNFSETVSTYGTSYARITVSYSYSASTNKYTVDLSNVEWSSEYSSFATFLAYGKVLINGTLFADYEGANEGYSAMSGDSHYPSYGLLNPMLGILDGQTIQVQVNNGGTITVSTDTATTVAFPDKGIGVITNGKFVDSGKKSGSFTLPTVTSTLTVNPNGGTWGGSTSSQTFTQQPTTTKPIANPTRTGYTFSGWEQTGGGSISGTTYTFGGTDCTLKAKWTANSYTLTLTKGNYISSVSGGGSKTFNTSVTATATLSTATGYTTSFDGWYEGSIKQSSSLSYTFSMPAGNLSLTAKGNRAAHTYSVKFNAKGGSGTMLNESFTYGVSKALTTNAFTKTGYTFKGWDTDPAGSTVVYTNGQSVTNLTATDGGTVNLYAVWQLNSYTLTTDPGSYATITVKRNGTTLPSGSTVYYGDVLTVTYSVNTGFYASTHTINGVTFASGATHTVQGNVSVYVRCMANSYALTTDPGLYATITVNRTSSPYGGASTGNITSSDPIYYGDVLKISFSAPTGYYLSAHTVNGVTFTSGNSHTVAGAVSVVARCRVYSYTLSISQGANTTISVNRNSSPLGGASTGPLQNGDTIYYSDVLAISISAGAGYNLGTHTVNGSSWTSGSYTVTGAVTVVSTATKKTFKLTIASGTKSSAVVSRTESPIGGASIGNLETNATLYYNDKLKITFSAQTGYHITTHTVNGSTFTSGNTYTVTAAVSVAAYSSANTYTVKYNANRGTASGSGTMADQSFTYDTSQKVTVNAFIRKYDLTYVIDGLSATYAVNSTFIGWARSASGTAEISDGASIINLTTTNNGTVNLYAKWTNGTTSLPNIPSKRGYTIKGWYTAASGGTKVGNAGDSFTPTANTTIYAQYVKITYKLTITKSNPGVTLTVHRDSSPIGGGSIANLSNNATLYVDDQLTITYEIAAGYTQDVATINGADFTSPKTISAVQGNVSVVVTVKLGGTVWIYDGSPDNDGWGLYQAYIYDGGAENNGWSLYQPYIYDGGGDNGWSLY